MARAWVVHGHARCTPDCALPPRRCAPPKVGMASCRPLCGRASPQRLFASPAPCTIHTAANSLPSTRQACVAATYAIKPLSLHERLHEPPPTAERPVMSSLRCVRGRGRLSSGPKRAGALWDTTAFLVGQSLRSPSLRRRISGTFTLGEIHSWVSACLPGVPARLQGERGEFAFRNLLVGTLLLCDYGPGKPAVMASEGAAPPSRLPVSRGRRLCLRLAHDPRHCQGGARQGSDFA